MRTYDELIKEHYDAVAAADGESSASTMADEIIRTKETDAICELVSLVALEHARKLSANAGEERNSLAILDVGCGNGFTLQQLQARFPSHKYVGIEQNASLRNIAATRANVQAGDIRDLSSISLDGGSFDIVVCQRVIINIMDTEDQKKALSNIIALAKPGAALLFIETFRSGLDQLNAARNEFGLSPIPPAIHNLPLPDDFLSPLSWFRLISIARCCSLTHYQLTSL